MNFHVLIELIKKYLLFLIQEYYSISNPGSYPLIFLSTFVDNTGKDLSL